MKEENKDWKSSAIVFVIMMTILFLLAAIFI
jgi:hypothetical protein